MEIIKSSENRVEVDGNVTNHVEQLMLTQCVNSMIDDDIRSLTIVFLNATAISSALLGYLIKIKTVNMINFRIIIKNEQLFELMEYMKVTETLNMHLEI